MKSIFLFGPFIGSFSWEFYRFAPYAIFMKKIYPKIQTAIFTRQERFDLYGQYADFLIPLKIQNDNIKDQMCFKLRNFNISHYNKLAFQFKSMYKERFNIEEHYYPDIIDYQFKVRWQFPRFQMNYDFRPRKKNSTVIESKFVKKPFILITPPYDTNLMKILSSCIIKNKLNKKYTFLSCDEFDGFQNINNISIDEDTSKIGYMIEIMKRSRLVIGPKSDLTHLALLLKCSVISWGNLINFNLINPFKTGIIMYKTIPYEFIENQLIKEL